MPDRPYDLLGSRLWPNGARPNVWAVLDGARDPQVWSMLYASTLQRECLYAGALHPKLEQVSPYLVQLEYGDPQTIRLVNRSWGKSWGIFLRAGMSMSALRRHLRSLLRVTGPAGKPLVFRYYDPRVMRIFLPTCSPAQLKQVFGSIEYIANEDTVPNRLIEFQLNPTTHRLEQSLIDLEKPVVV